MWESGKKSTDRLHILYSYPPTFAVSREMKNEFFDGLQAVIGETPSDEMYIILGG